MPRLSLYKPEKGNDYKFIDRQVSEMFQVGGTDVYLHKYLGTEYKEGDTRITKDITQIQDLVFLENRDRKYDTEIYRIRGMYNVQNIDFNLSQFGLFIDNDTLFMTVHINDFIKYLGRKPISGDVIELPHLRDEFALNDVDISLPRYYVIEDVGRASEGFSATWYPHLYRLKCKKLTNNQQFASILNTPSGEDADKFVGDFVEGTQYYTGQIARIDGVLYQVKPGFDMPNGTELQPPNSTAWTLYSGNTLEAILSTRAKELQINDAILAEAELDAPKSGYETQQFYTLAVDPTTGKAALNTADDDSALLASATSYRAGETNARPIRNGYTGYLLGDDAPPNGYDFGHGIQFPEAPGIDDFFLRTDFMPSRLFRFDGNRWIKFEDNVRMNMTNNNDRSTQKTSFINNSKFTYVDEAGFDTVTLVAGAIFVDTLINYATAPYVVLKFENTLLEYALADYPTLITNNAGKVRINLPVINNNQEEILANGAWQVVLYNHREEQRQSLSKALRPKADL